MLPSPPNIAIEELEKEEIGKGFLSLIRRKVIFHYDNFNKSKPCVVDTIARKNRNAVAIVPFIRCDGKFMIYLRSAIRPAVAENVLIHEEGFQWDYDLTNAGNLWELPAGLIEHPETPAECASRELKEELGFEIDSENFVQLGHGTYPAVGLCGEKIHFYSVDLTNQAQSLPMGDDSPMEAGAKITLASLEDLQTDMHEILDTKTELGLLRFSKNK